MRLRLMGNVKVRSSRWSFALNAKVVTNHFNILHVPIVARIVFHILKALNRLRQSSFLRPVVIEIYIFPIISEIIFYA